MKTRSRLILALLAVFAFRGETQAGPASSTVSGTVADYNVTSVRTTSGALTVPSTLNFTYTAGATVPIGNVFTITLPAGFTFSSLPALTASNGTTTVLPTGAGGQGVGFQSASFTVGGTPLLSTQTITLGAFGILAVPLETITPAVSSALSLTMQAISIDVAPLSLPAFASDAGIAGVAVGAIQFIDINPPSNGTQFLGTPDTYTAVSAAFAVQPQAPLLSAAGTTFTISPTDTATVTIFENFGGIGTAFLSSASSCLTPSSTGTVNNGNISFPNVPLNVEKFVCVTGNGNVIQSNPNGFSTVTVSPGTSTDFASANAIVEFPGEICYTAGNSTCVAFTPPAPPAVGTPTLSTWALYGLAGIMLAFGIWKLSTNPTT